jgi:hypothetical protein
MTRPNPSALFIRCPPDHWRNSSSPETRLERTTWTTSDKRERTESTSSSSRLGLTLGAIVTSAALPNRSAITDARR